MKRTKVFATVTAVVAVGALVTSCGSSGGSVGAKSADSGQVTAGRAWTRALTTPSGDAAVYLEVTNGTGAAVDITGASVPATIADSATLHETTTATDSSSTTMGETSSTTMGGTASTTMGNASSEMTMKELSSVTVDAHRTVRFMPGGKHIMLAGVKNPLSAGDSFPLTLRMSSGPNLRVTVTVRST